MSADLAAVFKMLRWTFTQVPEVGGTADVEYQSREEATMNGPQKYDPMVFTQVEGEGQMESAHSSISVQSKDVPSFAYPAGHGEHTLSDRKLQAEPLPNVIPEPAGQAVLHAVHPSPDPSCHVPTGQGPQILFLVATQGAPLMPLTPSPPGHIVAQVKHCRDDPNSL